MLNSDRQYIKQYIRQYIKQYILGVLQMMYTQLKSFIFFRKKCSQISFFTSLVHNFKQKHMYWVSYTTAYIHIDIHQYDILVLHSSAQRQHLPYTHIYSMVALAVNNFFLSKYIYPMHDSHIASISLLFIKFNEVRLFSQCFPFIIQPVGPQENHLSSF